MIRKDITLDERCEINDNYITNSEKKPCRMWVDIVRVGTDLTDDDINAMPTEDIAAIGREGLDTINPTKKKN